MSNEVHATSHHLTRLNIEFASLIAKCNIWIRVNKKLLIQPNGDNDHSKLQRDHNLRVVSSNSISCFLANVSAIGTNFLFG